VGHKDTELGEITDTESNILKTSIIPKNMYKRIKTKGSVLNAKSRRVGGT
jgi:hypothetical protein